MNAGKKWGMDVSKVPSHLIVSQLLLTDFERHSEVFTVDSYANNDTGRQSDKALFKCLLQTALKDHSTMIRDSDDDTV